MPVKIVGIIALAFLFLLSACNNNHGNSRTVNSDTPPGLPPMQDISIPGGFSSQTRLQFDSLAIPGFIKRFPAFESFRNDLEKFYAARHYAYAWYDEKGLIEQAGNLYNRIINIGEEGLPGQLPYIDSFRIVMDSLQVMDGSDKPVTPTELMLTAQYFAYAKTAWQGLSEKESHALDWHLPRKKVNLPQLMDSLLNDGGAFINKEPVYRQYGLLKSYLKKYRDLESSGGWIPLKADKKKYVPGDSSALIAAIRQRLYLLGDISQDSKSRIIDAELVNAIKAFQHRLGLKEDGVIGTHFFKEINYPVGKRIEQIIVNMERCRWLPERPEGDFLAVNIPDFSLHAYTNDSLLWSMNVVVGKAIHETVIFSSQLKYIVFSPYWNVPASILKNEILPAISRNPNYLASHNMEWYGNSVRQKPGPDNALGLVKFLFPNSYNIYLHDSPAKNLFKEDKRAFSHGCIRVSRARDLAKWLLRNYPEWTDEKIDAAMHAGKEQFFTLKKTVPVFVAYFTSWVDRQGRLNFREDVYKRDSRLAQMIMEKPRI